MGMYAEYGVRYLYKARGPEDYQSPPEAERHMEQILLTASEGT